MKGLQPIIFFVKVKLIAEYLNEFSTVKLISNGISIFFPFFMTGVTTGFMVHKDYNTLLHEVQF